MGGGAHEDLRASIAALWVEARPRALERVAVIEDAIAALLAGALDEERREAARGEAHKLAGAVGSFGVPGGTEHARVLERAFERVPDLRDVPELSGQALALRRAIEADPVLADDAD